MTQRKADVRFVILPGMAHVAKAVLDNFLVKGNSINNVNQHSRRELPRVQGEDHPDKAYFEYNVGLYWRKQTRDESVETALTGFTAPIIVDVLEDDFAESTRALEREAGRGNRTHIFRIPASQFASMNWQVDHLGAGQITFLGFGTCDHARAAIQIHFGDVPTRHVYARTVGRKIVSFPEKPHYTTSREHCLCLTDTAGK